ncbi:MAG: DNA repair protein RecN [Spirochaetota bacterium]
MLEELTVQNIALVDRLSIRFSDGLNILTGETGAGKSVLAGALGLLHGAKAETSLIRSGTEEAVVSGFFGIEEDGEAYRWLREKDIEVEEGGILIRRTIRRSGRGAIYIQSTPCTRSLLEEFTSMILDLHGQHEHQSLLVEANHRRLLDRFGGYEAEVELFSREFSELSHRKKHYEKMVASERERLREMDILQFAVNEIEAAALKEGEEEELDQERRLLSQHEKLFSALEEAYNALAENRGGALGPLRGARHSLESATGIDPKLVPLAQRLDESFFELDDVAQEIRSYTDSVHFSPTRLEEIEDRLALIHRLEKKYGSTIADLLAYLAESKEQLSSFETWEDDKGKLEAEIAEGERKVLAKAKTLSEKRKAAAANLSREIESILRHLGMAKSTFSVSVTTKTGASGKAACGPYGTDDVAFLISPNAREPLKPLTAIASGGEISRVMLAIKTVLAQSDDVSTLLFDEIDAGIGGEVALAVGKHLRELSRYKQVLCITHLASIAVRADNHIRVEKALKGDRTVTTVSHLSGDLRVEEIARMLAGDKSGRASRVHAEELLAKYGNNGED